MYSTKKVHLDAVFDLCSLLSERKREPNFQFGKKRGSKISKQTVVHLTEANGYEVIDGHYFVAGEHKFRFDITIINLKNRDYALTIYKKHVSREDLNLIYNEIVSLKKELIKRNNQKGGNPRPRELYLESGEIVSSRAKMRYVQAHLDDKYPSDLLEIYREMNFKISGHGKYPDLKNWEVKAKELGINF